VQSDDFSARRQALDVISHQVPTQPVPSAFSPGDEDCVSQSLACGQFHLLPALCPKLVDGHPLLGVADGVDAPVHPLVPYRDLGCTHNGA
jgi:hypothetical protein